MKILIVGGMQIDEQAEQSLRDFAAYLAETLGDKATVYKTYLDQLAFMVMPGRFDVFDMLNNIDAKNMDSIFIRDPKMRLNSAQAYYLSRYCMWNNIDCVNDCSLYYPGTKFAQSIIFLEEKVTFLKTIYCVNKERLIYQAEHHFGTPYILKTNVGSHGDSNYLIKSPDEAKHHTVDEYTVDFLAQEYCPNDRDYRLLLIGESLLMFERRGSSDTHLNNTSKGAVATKKDNILTQKTLEDARKISDRLQLNICGIDLMPNLETQQLYFLEINSQPQLRTGALLEEKRKLVDEYFSRLLDQKA